MTVGVLVLAACGSDGSEAEPSITPAETTVVVATTTAGTTAASTTMATATTSATTSTTTSTATSTTAPAAIATTATATTEPRDVPYWTAECVELAATSGRAYEHDAALVAFTTLGAGPTLDLVMPEVVTSVGPYGSIAGTAPIPGGVLVGVYPPDSWPAADEMLATSSLVAVDHDGTIRWRRCFDDLATRAFAVAPAALDPTVAWVVSAPGTDPLHIVGVDLATGADVAFPGDVSAFEQRGVSERFLVLGPPSPGGASADRYAIVDVLDGAVTEIPPPPDPFGDDGTWITVVDTDPGDDDVVLVAGSLWPGEIGAVFAAGAWTDEPTVLRDVLPPIVTETFGEPFELRLLDGAGDLIWAVPEFHSVGREGFHWAVTDDVVLAMRCLEWDADGSCGWVDDEPPEEELVAFDRLTGRELWTRPGLHAVPVSAGDRAIVTAWDEDAAATLGYLLIDLRTGERIGPDGEAWPSTAFAQECCGGDVYVNVQRSGGVVVATDMAHVRVWYPPELTKPTATVDLID